MIKNLLQNKYLLIITRVFVGGLFIYSSVDKIIDPLAFASIIHNYRITPPGLINYIVVIIPWIEFVAGVFLVIGFKIRASALVLNLLLVFFTIVLTITALRGINVSCGCFSTSTAVKSNLVLRIIEDIGILILGLHAMIFNKK